MTSAPRDLLLGRGGSSQVVLCAHDPLTGQDHRDMKITAPPGDILIADTMFAFQPECNDRWEYRIWVETDPDPDPELPGRHVFGQLPGDRALFLCRSFLRLRYQPVP